MLFGIEAKLASRRKDAKPCPHLTLNAIGCATTWSRKAPWHIVSEIAVHPFTCMIREKGCMQCLAPVMRGRRRSASNSDFDFAAAQLLCLSSKKSVQVQKRRCGLSLGLQKGT